MRNKYFSQSVRSEQKLYESIVIESLKIYGQDVYYLPRTIVNEDPILGEDVPSRFGSSHKIEMYIENTEGFDGEGDLFTKFGVEIRDEATFVVSRFRWRSVVDAYDNTITSDRPREGDLIYLPMTNKLFQINHVEHEQPFYQLSNLPVFKMRCQLFEYNDEDLDTNIDVIDNIEAKNTYQYVLRLGGGGDDVARYIKPGETVTQLIGGGVTMSGEVVSYSDSDDLLYVQHAGADDGKFHNFIAATTITITGAIDRYADSSFTVATVNQQFASTSTDQNEEFSTGSADFLDFTEDNPFGDPENN